MSNILNLVLTHLFWSNFYLSDRIEKSLIIIIIIIIIKLFTMISVGLYSINSSFSQQ